jgi:hypothetical protein
MNPWLGPPPAGARTARMDDSIYGDSGPPVSHEELTLWLRDHTALSHQETAARLLAKFNITVKG